MKIRLISGTRTNRLSQGEWPTLLQIRQKGTIPMITTINHVSPNAGLCIRVSFGQNRLIVQKRPPFLTLAPGGRPLEFNTPCQRTIAQNMRQRRSAASSYDPTYSVTQQQADLKSLTAARRQDASTTQDAAS
jgi:hypothetical protein